MRVLMISTVPFMKNGVSSVILNITENIDKSRYMIDVLTINKPDADCLKALKQTCHKVYHIDRNKKNIINYIILLKRLIATNRYDIVHIHGNSHTLALDLMVAKAAGCKIRIPHSHNTTCNNKLANKLLTPLFDYAYTAGVACGRDAGKWMFGKRKFTVINNGISTERFLFSNSARIAKRKELSVLDDEILICHVGRINKQKNHDFLIDVFCRLKERNKANYKLMLIGTGALMEDVKKKVGDCGLGDSVIFIGDINEVSEYLSASDMIVMPSLYEGFPVTLVEEQSNGLKCIISSSITKDVDLTGDVVFVPLGNPGYWSEIIENTDILADRAAKSKENIGKIISAGMDIRTEIKKIELIYDTEYKRI